MDSELPDCVKFAFLESFATSICLTRHTWNVPAPALQDAQRVEPGANRFKIPCLVFLSGRHHVCNEVLSLLTSLDIQAFFLFFICLARTLLGQEVEIAE